MGVSSLREKDSVSGDCTQPVDNAPCRDCSSRGTPAKASQFFTVYQTDEAIELHPGCPDQEEYRVICTCLYYEQACEIARISANLHLLPIRDFALNCASA